MSKSNMGAGLLFAATEPRYLAITEMTMKFSLYLGILECICLPRLAEITSYNRIMLPNINKYTREWLKMRIMSQSVALIPDEMLWW